MLFNCHTHTLRSHDSIAAAEAICAEALNKGLSGVALTDHCDCEFAGTQDIMEQFRLGADDRAKAKADFADRLGLAFGIELGDPLYAPLFAQKICGAFRFDIILLSIHAVRMQGYEKPFSVLDFSDKDAAFIAAYLYQYFSDVLQSVRTFDFDVLAHLTVPLQYITIKYGKTADLMPCMNLIEQILTELIKKDKALEINTSVLNAPNGFWMPNEDIIDLYISLGGKWFTLGSDAHTPQQLARGFTETVDMLRGKNVKSLCFYEQRQRRVYSID